MAQEPSDHELAYAIGFRADYGLDDGMALVRSTFQNPEAYPDNEWGLPLSRVEAEDLRDRTWLRRLSQPAVDYAVGEPEFGGLWFNQQAQGIASFRFTGHLAEHRAQLRERLPDGQAWKVLSADFTMTELHDLQDEITKDFPVLVEQDIPLNGIGASGRLNRVVVDLVQPSQGTEHALQQRYGAAVVTEVRGPTQNDACNSRSDCRPLKGGLKIHVIGGGSSDNCSSAFVAKEGSTWMLVTAGHCVQQTSGLSGAWEDDIGKIGDAENDTLPAPGSLGNPVRANADLGWIRVKSGVDTTPANQFYRQGHNYVQSYSSTASDGDQQEGDAVCRSGYRLGWICGLIVSRNTNKPNNAGHMVYHVWVMNKDGEGGEGGAIFLYRYYNGGSGSWVEIPAGVHVHSTADTCVDPDCRSWYSTVDSLESKSDLQVCTTSGC